MESKGSSSTYPKKKRKESSSVNMDLLSQLHNSMELKRSNIMNFLGQKNFLIPQVYKVPDKISSLNKSAYAPSVVSIGPLHSDEQHLQAMESQKLCYLYFLLYRFGIEADDAKQHKEFESAISETLFECMLFNPQMCPANYGDEAVVALAGKFLTDGGFILEYLIRNYHQKNNYEDPKARYIADVFLPENRFVYLAVKCDLLQQENQIPFGVLKKLFNMITERLPQDLRQHYGLSVTELVLSFFGGDDLTGHHLASSDDHGVPKYYEHILHLLHSCYMPPHVPIPTMGDPGFNHSATELDLAGVKLLAGDKDDLFNVKFSTTTGTGTGTGTGFEYYFFFWLSCRRACFEIPPLTITHSTEPFLRNLIAFEQISFAQLCLFTSHLFLMSKLVNSTEDVELLIKAGVIHNYLNSTEEVLHLFNNICKNVHVSEFYFVEPWKLASDHCKRFWPRCIATLRRDYFGSPWTVISVLAAFALFVLTFLQTLYTMRP